MNRKKETKLVITFKTTTAAMAMESICGSKNIEGRLIPIPREITAGCGLAFCTSLELENELKDLVNTSSLEYEGFHHCELFSFS